MALLFHLLPRYDVFHSFSRPACRCPTVPSHFTHGHGQPALQPFERHSMSDLRILCVVSVDIFRESLAVDGKNVFAILFLRPQRDCSFYLAEDFVPW